MPIGEQTPIASHTGNGVATVFAYSFGVLAAGDIKVLVDGTEVTTGFTVSGIGSRTGGTVTFSVAPTSGADILIVREVVRKRDTDYQYSGDLREEALDDDLDRIWMTLQEDGELVDRGVRVPVGETLSELPAAASRVDKVLTFGAGGAVALVDVAAFTGGGVVELVPADGSIALVKLTTAVQNLINGALQRSGGTMTGKIVLDGDATLALHPATKQQVDAAVSGVQALVAGRNRLINGTFAVNQRSFAGGARSAGVYGHDRWKAGSGGATYTVSGETATITVGTLVQVIEGLNVPEGGAYTLSWSGTAQARVDGGAYAASPITVTGKTAGANVAVEFGTGTVTRAQYEAGSTATGYERRLYPAELLLCKRYFYRQDQAMGGAGNATSQVFQGAIYHPAAMRAAPTIAASSVGLANGSSFAVGSPSTALYMAFITLAGAGPAFAQWVIDADAEL